MNYVRDLSGRRFGVLVALEPTDGREGASVVWACRCDCGRMRYMSSRRLTARPHRYCGCSHVVGLVEGEGMSTAQIALAMGMLEHEVLAVERGALAKLRVAVGSPESA